MKLLTKYKTTYHNIEFNLIFHSRMTIIDGESGIGKTMIFKAMKQDSIENNLGYLCLNYKDKENNNIEHAIKLAKNRIIIIDDADVVLTLEQKLYIARDKDNQYIIFAHSTEGFFPTDSSIVELIGCDNKRELVYDLLED